MSDYLDQLEREMETLIATTTVNDLVDALYRYEAMGNDPAGRIRRAYATGDYVDVGLTLLGALRFHYLKRAMHQAHDADT